MAYAPGQSGGVIRASLAAGPLFLSAMVLVAWMQVPGEVVGVSLNAIAIAPFALVLSMVPGFVLALPVNLAGSAMMRFFAQDSIGLRHPAAWAIIGGGVAGGLARFAGTGQEFTTVWAITGTACALLCRRDARWD